MKTCRIYFSLLLFLSLIMVSLDAPAAEEGFYRRFTLYGGNLSTVPTDVKAPVPGVLTAKYRFIIAKDFSPYVGTGLAYTYKPDAQSGDITKLKTGMAAQLGFNYLLGTNLTLKLDYKYLSISPDLPQGVTSAPPQSLGIGLDIRF